MVNHYVDNPKSEGKLKTAQSRLSRLRGDLSCLKAEDLHDAMKAVEVEAIMDCTEMVVAASLERKESRWGVYHRRVDFPERNDGEWKKFVVVHKGEGGRISVSTEPIPGG